MSLDQILKKEIIRLADKQVKAAVSKVHKPTIQLKHDVAALKRIVVALAKGNKRLSAILDKVAITKPAEAPEQAAKARITGKGIRSLRRKLRLSQAEFGRLIGVTAQAVVNMEKKNGPLAVRKVTRAAIVAIRGIGAREAKEKLNEMGAVKKTVKRGKKKA